MNKSLIAHYIINVIISCIIIWFFAFRNKDKRVIDLRSQQTINKIRHERDSVMKVNELQADSLQASTLRIHTLEFEKNQLHRESAITLREHEKLIKFAFIKFDSDSARLRELSILFPTIK